MVDENLLYTLDNTYLVTLKALERGAAKEVRVEIDLEYQTVNATFLAQAEDEEEE